MPKFSKPATVAFAAAVAAGLAGPGVVGDAAAAGGRVAVAADRPAWLATASPRAAVPDGAPVRVRVYLAGRDQAGLAALVRDVADPHSPRFRHYLTPERYRARFAPAAGDVAAVRSWLTGAGLRIADAPANHLYLTVTGTAAAAGRAFGTTLAEYRHDGATVREPRATPTAPVGVARLIRGVAGLSTGTGGRAVTAHDAGDPTTATATATVKARAAKPVTGAAPASEQPAPPPPGQRVPTPCSAYVGEKVDTTDPPAYGTHWPYALCGYTPQQLQGAYQISGQISSGLDGRGRTVAVVGAYDAPNMPADLNTYAGRHGLPAMGSGQFSKVLPAGGFSHGYYDGDSCGEQVWYLEEALDLDAVHSFAPGANILYMASASCDDGDLFASDNAIIDQHLADVVSNSWYVPGMTTTPGLGGPNGAAHQAFEQAAVEGITMLCASGDYGDDATISWATGAPDGQPAVNFPSVDPDVTSVGATALALTASGAYRWEDGWSIGASNLTNGAWSPAPPGTFSRASGGGAQNPDYPEPDYQKGVVPDAMAKQNPAGTAARVQPDISLVGENETGFLTGQTQVFPDGTYYDERRIGGTSLSTPLLAGIIAIADQMYGPQGFLNPRLYGLAGTTAFRDVVSQGQHAEVRLFYNNGADASGGILASLRTEGFPETTGVAPGYDNVTGLGSPRVLLKYLGPIGQ
ncbi:MAG: protease pro-enzyme activation domain-containing protein [Mycobacteriales bacterium]